MDAADVYVMFRIGRGVCGGVRRIWEARVVFSGMERKDGIAYLHPVSQ